MKKAAALTHPCECVRVTHGPTHYSALVVLDEEWRQAMVVEAQALEKEEAAREAVEACVLGTGEDVQGAHLAAMEGSAEATGVVETLARRRQAVKGAVERVRECRTQTTCVRWE